MTIRILLLMENLTGKSYFFAFLVFGIDDHVNNIMM